MCYHCLNLSTVEEIDLFCFSDDVWQQCLSGNLAFCRTVFISMDSVHFKTTYVKDNLCKIFKEYEFICTMSVSQAACALSAIMPLTGDCFRS